MLARKELAASRNAAIIRELRKAIARNRFILHYQPIVDAKQGQLVAYEALLRWRDPVRGLIAPDKFIGIAEETGLIVPIGLLALDTACRDAKRWHDRGHRIPVSVNVSARQFDDGIFEESVYRALELSGLPPSSLWIEITETAIMKDVERITKMLGRLRAHQVTIVLDDFGTGYSSLERLKLIPADVLKIDRTFIQDISSQEETHAVLSAILAVAKSRKMKVVGEGVEFEHQSAVLQLLGCDMMQGYHFARPRPIRRIDFKLLQQA